MDILQETADTAVADCNAKGKRQSCLPSKIPIEKLRQFFNAAAKRKNIVLAAEIASPIISTYLVATDFNLLRNGLSQYERPVTIQYSDITPSSTSSTGPTVTAWVDPLYPDLESFFYIDIEPTGPTPDDMPSTSLFCSVTASPSPTLAVEMAPALAHAANFCHDTAGSILGPGQPYNSTQEQYEGKFGYYANWATTDQCKDKSMKYTINETLCNEYLKDILGMCDPPKPDNPNAKHGGTVTDECMIFEFQPYQKNTPAPPQPVSPTTPAAPPPPAPTKPCPVSKFQLYE